MVQKPRKKPSAGRVSERTTATMGLAVRKRPAAVRAGVRPKRSKRKKDGCANSAVRKWASDSAWAIRRFGRDFSGAKDAYSRMANDALRMEAYLEAIARNVPGKIVLDLGTGPEALLAILCARAGAAKVFAIEAVPAIAEKAVAAVDAAGFSTQIEVIAGFSSSSHIPPVDLVVHEIIGNIATEEGVASSLADLRSRPEVVNVSMPCWSIPQRIETLCAPISLNIAIPSRRVSKGDREPPRTICLPFIPGPDVLLGLPQTIEVVEASASIELEQCRTLRWTIAKEESTFTGFACAPWLRLDRETVLNAWQKQTHWRHVLVMMESPTVVHAGDLIELVIRADLRHLPVEHKFSVSICRNHCDSKETLGTTTVRLE